MRRTALTIISSCIICSAAFSQAKELNLPPLKTYNKATLGFKDNPTEEQVRGIYLFRDSLIYQNKGRVNSYQYDQLRYIKINQGSHADLGAAIGGGLMLVSSLIAVLQVSSDPNMELRRDAGLQVALLTIGGAGIGALIGLPFKRKRTYYLHYR